MTTDWQTLIGNAAMAIVLRTGAIPSFQLHRRDLVALAEQMNPQGGNLAAAVAKAECDGFFAVRAEVWCGPLRCCIRVDEWVKG